MEDHDVQRISMTSDTLTLRLGGLDSSDSNSSPEHGAQGLPLHLVGPTKHPCLRESMLVMHASASGQWLNERRRVPLGTKCWEVGMLSLKHWNLGPMSAARGYLSTFFFFFVHSTP